MTPEEQLGRTLFEALMQGALIVAGACAGVAVIGCMGW